MRKILFLMLLSELSILECPRTESSSMWQRISDSFSTPETTKGKKFPKQQCLVTGVCFYCHILCTVSMVLKNCNLGPIKCILFDINIQRFPHTFSSFILLLTNFQFNFIVIRDVLSCYSRSHTEPFRTSLFFPNFQNLIIFPQFPQGF